jgi:hypothetical protein
MFKVVIVSEINGVKSAPEIKVFIGLESAERYINNKRCELALQGFRITEHDRLVRAFQATGYDKIFKYWLEEYDLVEPVFISQAKLVVNTYVMKTNIAEGKSCWLKYLIDERELTETNVLDTNDVEKIEHLFSTLSMTFALLTSKYQFFEMVNDDEFIVNYGSMLVQYKVVR